MNLTGIETAELERGMVLAPPNRLRPTQIIDAHVTLLEDAPRALRSRQRVRVHIGAAEVLARVRVLEGRTRGSPANPESNAPDLSHAQDARATIKPGRCHFPVDLFCAHN